MGYSGQKKKNKSDLKSQIKMKIKGIIDVYLMRVGMTSYQSMQQHPFNMRNTTTLMNLVTYVFCVVMFLIYDAKNLKEYTDSIYLSISVGGAALNFAFVNWEMAKIFRFIENLQHVVNASKFYMKINLNFWCC